MFEIEGKDIDALEDDDLRALVAKLARAELRRKGCPVSSVTAGGHQDAPDGGLDVRVDCPCEITNPDFVPRRLTGFQVKKPDMPPNGILKEMRPPPRRILRDVIHELADGSGAYVIVSARALVTDKSLSERLEAMRSALRDVTVGHQLEVKFYDQDQMAAWTNEYVGAVAWVRDRVGRHRSGWHSIDDWLVAGTGDRCPYLTDGNACLTDETSQFSKTISTAEGIARIRAALSTPGRCVRLIGLSGVGKTRLVEALFDEDIGDSPLDPTIAIYTDHNEEPDPTARHMAQALVDRRERAILIVDNCHPSTHATLTAVCTNSRSKVSLLTVEYDVAEDEPERTDVFRLRSASLGVVAQWVRQAFPEISSVDCGRIAEFSEGNFRVAGALSGTLKKGDTLGILKNRDLFERLFHQRNDRNPELLRAAEHLSLLYSIDGDNLSASGELNCLEVLSHTHARQLYEALRILRQRQLVQTRGRFHAILPHAIANRLATQALKRISPQDFDRFCAELPPRMIQSVSRRIGLLHDSKDAQAVLERWLRPDGLMPTLRGLSDVGMRILTHIAPVAPATVLAKIKQELGSRDEPSIFDLHTGNRCHWIDLIKALAYEADHFGSAVMLLARFLTVEPDGNLVNSARESFRELFRIQLSGTLATPEQRREAVRKLAASDDPSLRKCVPEAMETLLCNGGFVVMDRFRFGARPRSQGWQPESYQDILDWFDNAVELLIELAPQLEGTRKILARQVGGLWRAGCHEALSSAVETFASEGPWIEGWRAFRRLLRSHGAGMEEDERGMLHKIMERLKPVDPLNWARAIILDTESTGWAFYENLEEDLTKSWEHAGAMARKTGLSLAANNSALQEFLTELFAQPQPRWAHELGLGLAEGTDDPEALWRELAKAVRAGKPGTRCPEVLCGFLKSVDQWNEGFTTRVLDAAMSDLHLAPWLPALQGSAGLDSTGIARLRRALVRRAVSVHDFLSIKPANLADTPPLLLEEWLMEISNFPDGVETAIEILLMYFSNHEDQSQDARLINFGRDLLIRLDFSMAGQYIHYCASKIFHIFLTGGDCRIHAEKVCSNVRTALEGRRVHPEELRLTLQALFKTQPAAALDAFLPSPHFRSSPLTMGMPVESADHTVLKQWADRDPGARYPWIARHIAMFDETKGDERNAFSPLFEKMLSHAPDQRIFLDQYRERLIPVSCFGSIAGALTFRKAQLVKLANRTRGQVGAWMDNLLPEVNAWIMRIHARDRREEESFE